MPELSAILKASRDKDYVKNRFLAALQGVDLEESNEKKKSVSTFEDIKARVFSNGQAQSADDILSLQGINAQTAGFGIGMGLDYSDAKDLENPSW